MHTHTHVCTSTHHAPSCREHPDSGSAPSDGTEAHWQALRCTVLDLRLSVLAVVFHRRIPSAVCILQVRHHRCAGQPAMLRRSDIAVFSRAYGTVSCYRVLFHFLFVALLSFAFLRVSSVGLDVGAAIGPLFHLGRPWHQTETLPG